MRAIYKTIHNLAARLGWERIQMWSYMRWMRWYMDKDPLLGYFVFSEDFLKNSYVKR